MSPAGKANSGIGGSGGGTGIGRGNGPGGGFSGKGPGAAKTGAGRGSDVTAKNGVSPYSGPGGAGTAASGSPAMSGVSVAGGSNAVTLPSFGSDTSSAGSAPGRSSLEKKNAGPDITVIATSRSGGALGFYGALKGDKVYTIYLNTSAGIAVMQFADPASAAHPYAEDLNAPQPLRTDLPANLDHSRLVVAAILDQSGDLKNLKVLEQASSETTTRIVAALSSWKFRPVYRAETPIEVNAILGFNIDTR
jgi:hypothetical protein